MVADRSLIGFATMLAQRHGIEEFDHRIGRKGSRGVGQRRRQRPAEQIDGQDEGAQPSRQKATSRRIFSAGQDGKQAQGFSLGEVLAAV